MPTEPQMTRCPQCGNSFPSTVKLCPNDGTVLEHASATATQLGKVLDSKYRLDVFLSHGGMGAVYRATHVMLGRTVAVKLINPELVTSPEIVRRFQREARAANALNHPNIVSVYDLGQTADGTLYIAMEFIDGPSLKSVIQHGGPVAAARTIFLLRQVASALSVAHRHNIVHRDLKPHNIMIAKSDDGQEVAKLVDFGIAKTFDEVTQLTMTGYALGTPQYMAPEQAEGRPVDARSDLYALGVILYEMLSGDVPFNDTSAPAILVKQIKEPPVPPSLKNPGAHVPADLEAVALRCLEKDPAKRFQKADEFAAALGHAAASIPGAEAAMQATLPMAPPPAMPPLAPTSPLSDAPTAQLRPGPGAAGPPATQPVASAPQGTRATAIQPSPSPVVPAGRAPNRSAVVALVLVLMVVAASAVGLGLYLKQQRERSAASRAAEPPHATPAMAVQPPTQSATSRGSAEAGATTAVPVPERGKNTLPSVERAAPNSTSAAAATPLPPTHGKGVAESERSSSVTPTSGVRASTAVTKPEAVAEQPGREAAPPAFPANPAVFFHCAGAPEVCSALRSQVDEAFEKAGLSSVRSAGRADVDVAARVEGLQEKVSQQFGTTFAVRSYSIEVTAETTKTSEAVSMPSSTTVSFDPQFGSERVVEKARLVASDIADKLKAFAAKKTAR